jgi:deazaflavin-dependent oxidoreductase (nitroreductase family)
MSWKEHNAKIIASFRENEGKIPPEVNETLAQIEVVVVTMKGARSGVEYVVPLTCFSLGEDDFFVVATAGGAPQTPSWYYNLKAHADVLVERGVEKYSATAVLVEDPAERARLYTKTIEMRSEFAAYEQKAGRPIPVFVVQRKRDQ